MLCGNAAMEAITAITNSTATLFQMQQATNMSKPFPFPTARETDILERAYDNAATRGRPTHTAITALMLETGVGVKEIKALFTDARKARGHSTPGDGQSREAAASIEVRTRHPTPSNRSHPTSTYVPLREEEDTGTRQGEYYEEEVKVDVSPSWMEPPTGGITLYAYGGEYASPPGFPILDTTTLLDRTDAESQDSGFEGTRNMEIDIKDHGIEGCSAAPEPRIPVRNGRTGSPRGLSTRDPRTRHVSLAGPTSLYGKARTPMADLQNIAQNGATDEASLPSDGEEKLVIVLENE